MSKNITYLLGAGASFEALPIVDKIPERLEFFANAFRINNFEFTIKNEQKSNIAEKHLFRFSSIEEQKIEYEKIKKFHQDILWLKDEALKHSSIDTFAKKLYLKKDSNLKKLKYILSCFFLYEQTYNFDKRYDSFFASILESLSELPKNLKIISWNYDSQLEIAYNNFSGSSLDISKEILNVYSKGEDIKYSSNKNQFTTFKVNGTTSLYQKGEGFYNILADFNIDSTYLVSSFLEIYSSVFQDNKNTPDMSFAWENFNEDSGFYKNLKESIEETDILIVIGYSFPFFNRKIDKLILDSMPKLKKIYVQDPKNAADIIEKMKGLIPDKQVRHDGYIGPIVYVPKIFVDQFFIPIEF
jgi:hypothetical protein